LPLSRHVRKSVVSSVLALSLVVTACGSGNSKSSAKNQTSSQAAATKSGHGGTLIVGMTAANIPPLDTVLAGQQGYEGDRFVGNQLYDGLTRFDLLQSTSVPQIIPDLATSWTANSNGTQWTFQLRPNVAFQDGTPFNADAVIFNLQRYGSPGTPYYDATLSAVSSLTTGAIASYTKTSDLSLEITTRYPDAHLPSDLATLYMASPTAVQKYGNTGFGSHPVGTGPFEFKSEVAGQELDLLSNPNYWAGAPKLSELVLKPIPDATARIAALRSGEVNWIEYPTPDDIAGLQAAGYQVLTNSYDHIWPWIFDTTQKPWNDVRVRQAANFAINRDAMATDLLKGTADPAYQLIPRANAGYDPANNYFSYDPSKAKALLAAAGYPNGVSATVSYPTSGSGNMIPGPMNEELQQDLAAVGIHVTLVPLEWASMLTTFETGKMPGGTTATNISLTFQQEAIWQLLFGSTSPLNSAHFKDPQVDSLLAQAQSTVDPTARGKLYAQAGALITQAAPWLFVVNDRNPRALAPSVHGFIEPKSWFVNLTTVWVS
jgi:peptide/nickel transport system substrate-binding protein